MMNKQIYFLLALALSGWSVGVHADSSVWKISSGENYFYLGGTVHLLNESDHPLPEEFSKAYKDASQLIFETDIGAMNAPEIQQKLGAVMVFTDERTLQGELKPETYTRLQEFLVTRRIPIETFQIFRPWAVGLTLSVLEYQRLGMVPEYGVDEYFYRLALSDKKEIHGLESPEQQIEFITAMENVEPNLSINYVLNELDHLPKFIDLLKASWRSGDVEAFTKHIYIVQMRTEFPELYDTLVVKRNDAWMPELMKLNDDSKVEFVLVGAMHLNSHDGLLHKLKERGFKVQQL